MTQGCKCPSCFGLREWLEAEGLDTRGLPAAPGHETSILRVVTLGADDVPAVTEVACTGGYCCDCPDCTAAVELRVRRGVQASRSLPVKRAA